jgi:hypothetical protein
MQVRQGRPLQPFMRHGGQLSLEVAFRGFQGMWEPCSVQCYCAAGMKRVTPEELVLYLAAQHLQKILHRRELQG